MIRNTRMPTPLRLKLLIFLLISLAINAQEKYYTGQPTENLKIEINRESDSLLKFKGYKQIAQAYLETEIDSALKYVNKAIDISKNFQEKSSYAEAIILKSEIQYNKNSPTGAISALKKLIDESAVGKDGRLLASIYKQLGNNYALESVVVGKVKSMVEADIAYEYALIYGKDIFTDYEYIEVALDMVTMKKYLRSYEKALANMLQLVDRINTKDNIENSQKSRIYNLLGSLYIDLKKEDEALEYANLAKNIDSSSNNIVRSDWVLANAYKKQKKYKEAEILLLEIEKLNNGENVKKSLIPKVYNCLGELYLESGSYDDAIVYFIKGLDYQKKNRPEYPILQHQFYNGLAQAYYEKRNLRRAKEYCNSSIQILTENEIPVLHLSWKQGLVDAYGLLSEIAKDTRNFEASLSLFEKAENIKEQIRSTEAEIYSVQNSRMIENLIITHKTKEKDNEILLLTADNNVKDLRAKQQNRIVWIIAICSIILLLSLVFVLRLLKQKKESNILLEEKHKENTLLVKEIHHRVKNNLQIIQSLIGAQINSNPQDKGLQEVLKESQNRVRSMSIIHQNLYQSNNFSQVNAKDYFKDLLAQIGKTYASDANVTIESDVDDVVINMALAVPLGLIVNELVTNAFKYAFTRGKDGDNRITVNFHWNETLKKYKLEIKDNGIGFEKNIDFSTLSSYGMQLVQGLVHQLDGELNMKNEEGAIFDIYLQGPKAA